MTMDISADSPEQEFEALLHQRYRVEPEWYLRTGLSFDFAVRQRISNDAAAAIEDGGARRPVREAGKVTFQRGGGKDYANDPMAVIQDYCADSAEYRDPALPLKEIMFRLLLLRGNEPMNVEEFYEAVLDWVKTGDGRVITPEVIQRLLAADQDYGFLLLPD